MTRLPDKATAEEAKRYGGFDDVSWRRFLTITKEVARVLIKKTPNLLWKNVRYNEKMEVKDKINEELRKDAIGEVEYDLIGWRLSRVLGALRHMEAQSSTKKANDAADASLLEAAEPSTTRPYDPVRDI
ncbi:hypothetical protein CC86DRAFT_381006 [Ophiobolus disseminans]|uniref:Uncharacterized protein n=1 Tax=Ophiobolus disseminans TaxID=1469910 RepID=A0A6A7A4G3_9PLEO|nr:hypothetical protein CC86DRAFT_381006 [Ophiobolus disseminans]